MKKLNTFLLWVALIGGGFTLSACQPTPETAQFQKVESVLECKDDFSQTASLTDGIQLCFSSKININDSSFTSGEFSVGHYSNDLVSKVYKSLCGDAQIFQHTETEQQLVDYVVYGKKSLELLSGTLSEDEILFEQTELDNIFKHSQDAPTEKLGADLDKITEYEQGLVDLQMGGQKDAIFQVLLEPRYWIFFSNYQRPIPSNEPCEAPLKMSLSDAVSLAERTLAQIGILNDFCLVRTKEEIINYAYFQTFFDDSTKNKAHVLLYLRKIDSSNQLDDSRVLLGTDSHYDLSFLQEYILFKMDDNGILSFEWNTPGELEMAEEPQSIITFDDAAACQKSPVVGTFFGIIKTC